MLTMLKMPTNPADANDAVVGGDGDGVHLMDTTIILASKKSKVFNSAKT